jgi:hypothetical protein
MAQIGVTGTSVGLQCDDNAVLVQSQLAKLRELAGLQGRFESFTCLRALSVNIAYFKLTYTDVASCVALLYHISSLLYLFSWFYKRTPILLTASINTTAVPLTFDMAQSTSSIAYDSLRAP